RPPALPRQIGIMSLHLTNRRRNSTNQLNQNVIDTKHWNLLTPHSACPATARRAQGWSRLVAEGDHRTEPRAATRNRGECRDEHGEHGEYGLALTAPSTAGRFKHPREPTLQVRARASARARVSARAR